MRVLIFSLVIFSFHSLVAQEPIVWSAIYQQANKKIVFNAAIEKGWHVYSQFIDPSAGPVPTSFVIDSGKGFSLTGGVVEPKPIVAFDESFEAEVAFFEKNVSFEQKINVFDSSVIKARVTYMLCNNETCLPPTETILTINIYP
jgi:DsbC/DsbD-like thiol-disulfide interchange protein